MVEYVLHKNDLPADVSFGQSLAIDTEFMGLNPWRDRLCLMQVYDGQPGSKVHIVQFESGYDYASPNIKKILSDTSRLKILYYARGDMRWIGRYLGILLENLYCVKIASRIARTYTQSHDLEDSCADVLGFKLPKEQQCSDWGTTELTKKQLEYACNDVVHLHKLMEKFEERLKREKRHDIAHGLFKCIPHVVRADLGGWYNEDHFSYFTPKV